MSDLSSWVLSIAGICILSVLIDLFLPSGQISSHIKTVFNFIIIFVIIAPIPKFIKNYQVDYSSFINTSEIELQEDYIYQLNRDKLTALENEIKNGIKSRGILNVDIAISADIFVKAMEINGIFVDLTNAVIEKNEQHIDIKKEVEEVILSKVNIEKEKIEYSGG